MIFSAGLELPTLLVWAWIELETKLAYGGWPSTNTTLARVYCTLMIVNDISPSLCARYSGEIHLA